MLKSTDRKTLKHKDHNRTGNSRATGIIISILFVLITNDIDVFMKRDYSEAKYVSVCKGCPRPFIVHK